MTVSHVSQVIVFGQALYSVCQTKFIGDSSCGTQRLKNEKISKAANKSHHSDCARRAACVHGVMFLRKFRERQKMGRQRVPKGKIFLKKDEKIIAVLLTLKPDVSGDDFVQKFKEMYPEDWMKVVKRYQAHERLTPKGKSHPMPKPHQYMLNASQKIRELYSKGKDLNELHIEINTPKPKFVEDVPPQLEKWLNQLQNRNSFEERIDAINKLGKFKCDEVIKTLSSIMESDKVDEVRDTAYQRLKRFGLEIPKPKKAGSYTDPGLCQKFQEVADSLKIGFSYERFESQFRSKFPEEFDLQKYTKKNRFKPWLKKQMTQVTKA